jgi:peptide/nickel transport system permease protein
MSIRGSWAPELGRVVGAKRTLVRLWRDERLGVVGIGLILILLALVIVGPFFEPYDPNALGEQFLSPPSGSHLMGTDQFGRDVLSRWLDAGRASLIVAVGSIGGALVFGTLAGLVAGYRSGSVDTIIGRIVDAILSVPTVVLVIALAGVVGVNGIKAGPVRISGEGILILILGIAFLPTFTRIARANALAEMQEDYVAAARANGAGAYRIMFSNLLPNVAPALVIQASFSLALAISAEATISFLGFGIQPPQSSWGNLLNASRDYLLQGKWWLLVFPAAIIVLAVFAFNILGDALRDLLDPHHRSRAVGPLE